MFLEYHLTKMSHLRCLLSFKLISALCTDARQLAGGRKGLQHLGLRGMGQSPNKGPTFLAFQACWSLHGHVENQIR